MKHRIFPSIRNTWNNYLQSPLGQVAHVISHYILNLPKRKPHYFSDNRWIEAETIEETVHNKGNPNNEHLLLGSLYHKCAVVIQSQKGDERRDTAASFGYDDSTIERERVEKLVNIANAYKQEGYTQKVTFAYSLLMPEEAIQHGSVSQVRRNVYGALRSYGVDFKEYSSSTFYGIVTDKGVLPYSRALGFLAELSKERVQALPKVSTPLIKENDITPTANTSSAVSHVERLQQQKQAAVKQGHGRS